MPAPPLSGKRRSSGPVVVMVSLLAFASGVENIAALAMAASPWSLPSPPAFVAAAAVVGSGDAASPTWSGDVTGPDGAGGKVGSTCRGEVIGPEGCGVVAAPLGALGLRSADVGV